MSEAITIRRVQDGVQYDHEIYVGEKRWGFYDSIRNRMATCDYTLLEYIQGLKKAIVISGPQDALMLFKSAYSLIQKDFPDAY